MKLWATIGVVVLGTACSPPPTSGAEDPGASPPGEESTPEACQPPTPPPQVADEVPAELAACPPLPPSDDPGPRPMGAKIWPAAGPLWGSHTQVAIYSDVPLAVGTTITFGGVSCGNVSHPTNHEKRCFAPAHAAGKVDVVATDGVNTFTIPAGYEYRKTAGTARLVSLNDFGRTLLGFQKGLALTFANGGDESVSGLQLAVAPPFRFKGGAYPGVGGSCGSTLSSRASCSVVLEFAPSEPGLSCRTLRVSQAGAPPTDWPVFGSAEATPKEVDPTFGLAGFVKLPRPSGGAFQQPVPEIILWSGDALLLANQAWTAEGGGVEVRRIDPCGNPDPKFGLDGSVRVPLGPYGQLGDLLALEDGTFMVLGSTGSAFELFTFDAQGRPALGPGGAASQRVLCDGFCTATALRRDPSGRLLVVVLDTSQRGSLYRLVNGALDPTFGDAGVARVHEHAFPSGHDVVVGAALPLEDGGYLVAGRASRFTGTRTANAPFVARLLDNGRVDPGFAVEGIAVDEAPYVAEPASELLRSGDGGFLALVPSGWLKVSADGEEARFVPLPATVGMDAAAQGPLDTMWFVSGTGLALLSRVHDDGALDVTFGASGQLQLPFAGLTALDVRQDGAVAALAVQGEHFVAFKLAR